MNQQEPTKRSEDHLLTEQTTAGILRVSTRSLQEWRRKRIGPTYIRLGRQIRYRTEDIESWIESNSSLVRGVK